MIVDTNALSGYADDDPRAVAAMNSAASIEIPVIALGEYAFGIEGSRKAKVYASWLAEMLRLTTVLAIDSTTASHYAQVRQELKLAGTPIPANDLWIAALARQHRVAVLSRDRHFDVVKGLQRVAW